MSKDPHFSTANYEDKEEETEHDKFGQISMKIHSKQEKHRAADHRTLELPVSQLASNKEKEARNVLELFQRIGNVFYYIRRCYSIMTHVPTTKQQRSSPFRVQFYAHCLDRVACPIQSHSSTSSEHV